VSRERAKRWYHENLDENRERAKQYQRDQRSAEKKAVTDVTPPETTE